LPARVLHALSNVHAPTGVKVVNRLLLGATLAVVELFVSSAWAQDAASSYPAKPIQIVVPFAAGGGTDLVARLVGNELSRGWRQPVVVENRPGAGGNIGAALVARSIPDGHTLLATPTGAVVLAPYAFDDIGYRPADLTTVSILVSLPQILLVPSNSPFKTLAELLSYAQANPGKLNVGSSGKGTGQQMAVELLMRTAKVSLTDVGYRGSSQATSAIIAGEIDLLFSDPSALPYLESGRLRALGVTTRDRVALLPDVPAIGELVAGYEAASYYGLFAPSATSPDVQNKINAGVVEVLRRPEISTRLAANGMEVLTATAQQSQAFVQGEAEKWGGLIRTSGIKLK
jgi:tripartite-type tricarboxylate transporter receptor subunit TctC